MLKRSILALALIAGLAATGAVVATGGATASPMSYAGRPAVYLVPHQDDESITFSRDIMVQQLAGNPVELYLFTDGHETGVCTDRYLNLSDADCTDQRDREFSSAVGALGIGQEHIHYVKDPATGTRPGDTLSMDAARRMLAWVIDDVDTTYPGHGDDAMYKSMSWNDYHPGHARIGQALREAHRAGTITDARFFLKRNIDGTWPERPAGTSARAYGPQRNYDGRELQVHRMVAALHCYGIGWLSVGTTDITNMLDNLDAKMHTPEGE